GWPSVTERDGAPMVGWEDATSGPSQIYARRYDRAASRWIEVGTGGASGDGISGSSTGATQPRLVTGGGAAYLLWLDADGTGAGPAIYARRWNGVAFVEELPSDASFTGIAPGAVPEALAVAVDQTRHPFVAWQDATEVTLTGCTVEGPGLTLDGGRDIQIVHSVIDAIGTGLTLTGGVSGAVVEHDEIAGTGAALAVTGGGATGLTLRDSHLRGG